MRTEFYSDKVMFQNEQIFNLYHKLRPLYAEIFGKENVRRDIDKVGAYSSFEGSPLSEGKFQFDLWNVTPGSGMYNWEELRHNIMKYGVRNSLCVAPMPTASTSQILANNECFEPFTSNVYSRRTLAGEFVIANKYLIEDALSDSDGKPSEGRWYWIGKSLFIELVKSKGFQIINEDINTDKTNIITLFKKS